MNRFVHSATFALTVLHALRPLPLRTLSRRHDFEDRPTQSPAPDLRLCAGPLVRLGVGRLFLARSCRQPYPCRPSAAYIRAPSCPPSASNGPAPFRCRAVKPTASSDRWLHAWYLRTATIAGTMVVAEKRPVRALYVRPLANTYTGKDAPLLEFFISKESPLFRTNSWPSAVLVAAVTCMMFSVWLLIR